MSKNVKCRAKNPENCRYHGSNKNLNAGQKPEEKIIIAHGVPVVAGKLAVSNFAKGFNTRSGMNGYYTGTWGQLERLVKKHQHNFEPGTGSVDNDVILVNLPPLGFYTSIVKITDENAGQVEEIDHVRMDGEKPVSMKVIKGIKPPARFVKAVLYRADVLAADNDRSSNAEWEIIALNTQLDEHTPMHPTTMLRNSNHEEGGTLRTYSDEEWEEAYKYWDNHAFIQE